MKQEKPELFYLKPLEQVPGHKLLLNRRQLALFALAPGRRLNLQVGFNRLPVEVAEHDDDSALTTLYLSGAAFAELDHYHGEPLWLAFLSDNKMVLGPTVGITVSAGSWEKIDKIYALEKRALLALEKGILFYCFQLSKVDPEKRLVEAYYYHPREHSWRRKFLPLPQVLYHRSVFPCQLPAKQAGKLNVYEQIWGNSEIQKINNACRFDKWSVYQTLSRSEETEKFQPETVLLSPLSLKEFLSKYKFCYVKNSHGRGGRQVFRVQKAGTGYICKAGGSKIRLWKFRSLKKLYFFLRNKLGEDLILQEGISLACLNNRPFDIRVLAQKNLNAEWVISALSFRVAAPEAAVTNIAAGAEEITLAPGDNLLGTGLSMEALEIFTRKILLALESFYGSLGEVGLDIALDVNGKMWLLEANSQPSSRGYKEAATEELCNEIFGLPLDYAKYLAKCIFGQPENHAAY